MAGPTRWQRGALRVNAWDSIDPEAQLGPLAAAGYQRVEVLVNALRQDPPLGPVPRSWVDRVKRAGFAEVFIVVWADSFADPIECADFCISEKRRLNANGIIVNAEDGVEARDLAGERWSERFLARVRSVFPRLPLAIDTYIGCGGIALKLWQRAKARLICQTHHEAALFEWGVEGYVAWATKYGWIGKADLKPEFAVYKNILNERPNRAAQIESARRAGTIGLIAYYAEGVMDVANWLVDLLREAQAAGVCR